MKNLCVNCKSETNNPKFCSKSCSAKFNNHIHPKRIKKNKCKSCKISIASNRTYCSECYLLKRVDYNSISLKELELDKGTRNRYQTVVRSHARSVANQHKLLDKCKICNYSIYVECCHIKSVSSFNSETLLEVVNSPSNLVGLCPNHHKELDLGILQLS